jgi:hypothetical protein
MMIEIAIAMDRAIETAATKDAVPIGAMILREEVSPQGGQTLWNQKVSDPIGVNGILHHLEQEVARIEPYKVV